MPKPARRAGVLAGCLIALAVLVVIVIIAVIYIAMNWRGWTASTVQAATTAIVSRSGLPPDQQTQINGEVQKLTDGFKNGTVTLEELRKVGEAIADSPLLSLGAVQFTKQKYIEPSDMTAEEKAAANRSVQRFARGVYEKKIPTRVIDDVVKPITTLKPDGRWELKDKPTRQELDQFLANVKQKADDANIPDEPFDLNIAQKLQETIETALGRKLQ